MENNHRPEPYHLGSTSVELPYRPRFKRKISAFLIPWNKTVCLFCGNPLTEARHNSAAFERSICTGCSLIYNENVYKFRALY